MEWPHDAKLREKVGSSVVREIDAGSVLGATVRVIKVNFLPCLKVCSVPYSDEKRKQVNAQADAINLGFHRWKCNSSKIIYPGNAFAQRFKLAILIFRSFAHGSP